MNILELNALELGELIKNGQVKCIDAVNAVLEAINNTDKYINAYITVNASEARERALFVQNLIDNGEALSPLAGVPIAIKDNICTKNIPTTCASKMLNNFIPFYNATVIDRLERAGMIVLGKTNMDEFAMGSSGTTSFYGKVKNPYDVSRIPGGSSSGSAAAVSAGEAIISLGSDTGGSIRQPASFCGLTGFKPTYGAVSRYGLVAYASSFDQIGPIAKNAADCMALMDIISGHDPLDGTSLNKNVCLNDSNRSDLNGIKIALPKQCFSAGVEKTVKNSILSFAEKLKKLGAKINEIDLPFFDYAVSVYYIIATAQASSNLSRYDGVKYGFRAEEYKTLSQMYAKTRTEGFGNEVKKRILLGTFVLSSGYYDDYYNKALNAREQIVNYFDSIFEEYDLILTPTTVSVAPRFDEFSKDDLKQYIDDIFTVPVNLAGLPAVSVPCGADNSGLPIGAQLIGNRNNDSLVLKAAEIYQNKFVFDKKSRGVSK